MAALPTSERDAGGYDKASLSQAGQPQAEQMLKQYDAKIFGSSRAQSTNQFVATRRQHRADQLKQVQTSLITNATLRVGAVTAAHPPKAGTYFTKGPTNQHFVASPLSSKLGMRPLQFASVGQRSADLDDPMDARGRQPGQGGGQSGAHSTSMSPQDRAGSPGYPGDAMGGANFVVKKPHQVHQSYEAPSGDFKRYYGTT